MNQMNLATNITEQEASLPKEWNPTGCDDLLSVGSSSAPSFFKEDEDSSLPDLVVEDSEGSNSSSSDSNMDDDKDEKMDGFSVTEITISTNSTASTALTCNVENPSAESTKKRRKPRDPPEQRSNAHEHLLKRVVSNKEEKHNNQASLERQRQARITLAKRKKEKILMLTRVLLNHLQQKDPEAYIRAVNVIQICAIHQKNRIKGFESLTVSIQRELRREVGEDNWDCARAFLENRLVKEAQTDHQHLDTVGKESH